MRAAAEAAPSRPLTARDAAAQRPEVLAELLPACSRSAHPATAGRRHRAVLRRLAGRCGRAAGAGAAHRQVHRPSGWSPASTPGDPSEHVASDPTAGRPARRRRPRRVRATARSPPGGPARPAGDPVRQAAVHACRRGARRGAHPPQRRCGSSGARSPSAPCRRRPRTGARLVLGPRAVLTPLARDKARALGSRSRRSG